MSGSWKDFAVSVSEGTIPRPALHSRSIRTGPHPVFAGVRMQVAIARIHKEVIHK